MKIGSVYHILVFFVVILVFSISFVTFAQQNSELSEAVVAAERDAKTDVDQSDWWIRGCCLFGASQAGNVAEPSPERLVGKSPEYVEVYTQVYKAKAKNLQRSAATPGCLTTVFSAGILFVIFASLD